jgi:hypothetical protein
MVVAAGEGGAKKVVVARAAARRGAAKPRVSVAERSGLITMLVKRDCRGIG